jgi:hypothetical protein
MRCFYLAKTFVRKARRSEVNDEALREAMDRAEAGQIDADLGGGLIKQRVARCGEGRSGGFRTIVAYWQGERAIFLYLFAKNRKANLSEAEFDDLKETARLLRRLGDDQLRDLAASRGWREIERY